MGAARTAYEPRSRYPGALARGGNGSRLEGDTQRALLWDSLFLRTGRTPLAPSRLLCLGLHDTPLCSALSCELSGCRHSDALPPGSTQMPYHRAPFLVLPSPTAPAPAPAVSLQQSPWSSHHMQNMALLSSGQMAGDFPPPTSWMCGSVTEGPHGPGFLSLWRRVPDTYLSCSHQRELK